MAAATAVFNTFELLENVIIHLPIANILVMSRVCKSGRSVLEKSLEIRRILFESELPGRDVHVKGVSVNNGARKSHWIFRTKPSHTPLDGPKGRFLVFTTPITRFIIFAPEELSRNIICNGIRLSVIDSTRWGSYFSSFAITWSTGDGTVLGFHTVLENFYKGNDVFGAYVRTYYRAYGDRERGVKAWHGGTRIFAGFVPVKLREEGHRCW